MSSVRDLIAQVIAAAEQGANPPGMHPKPWQHHAADLLIVALHIDSYRTTRLAALLEAWPTPTPATVVPGQLDLFETAP